MNASIAGACGFFIQFRKTANFQAWHFGEDAGEVLKLKPRELVFQPTNFDLAKEHIAESCELRRRNGEHLFIEVSTHAVFHQSGEIAHFEGIVRDISDRKKMQEAMLHTQK